MQLDNLYSNILACFIFKNDDQLVVLTYKIKRHIVRKLACNIITTVENTLLDLGDKCFFLQIITIFPK